MRIAVGGFLHESHSFAPRPATYANFLEPGGWPPLTRGDALIPTFRDKVLGLSGAIAVGESAGATLVPLAWATASPCGPVQGEAFERITALICASLSDALDAGPLDGVFLDLHGAGVSDGFADMEGEILRRVRAIVGEV